MTNREWLLKNTSDGELAKVIDSVTDCDYCIYNTDCMDGKYNCEDGIVKWLKKEHKDDK